jgi:hypothetical protein
MLPTSLDPALIEYSFASKLYRDERWRLQEVACTAVLSRYKVAFAVFGSSSWLIDVPDGYVVSIGAYLAFMASLLCFQW